MQKICFFNRNIKITVLSVLLLIVAQNVPASSDSDECYPCIKMQPVITPMLDSRAMLALLLLDPRKESDTLFHYKGELGYTDEIILNSSRWSTENYIDPSYTLTKSSELFAPFFQAVKNATDLSEIEKSYLGQGSQVPESERPSIIAREYNNYLKGREAFYAAKFDEAAGVFNELITAKSPWIAETSQYNLIRVYLRKAFGVTDEYGFTNYDRMDLTAADSALSAINEYLRVYPNGLYSTSAEGLKRRAYWIKKDREQLGRALYALIKNAEESQSMDAIEQAVFEMDNTFLFTYWDYLEGLTPEQKSKIIWENPPLAFAQIMITLRTKPIDIAALQAHEKSFSDKGYQDLYRFLVLAAEFYGNHDNQKVIEGTEDWRSLNNNSYVGYSLLALRAFALEGLKQWDESAKLWTAIRSMDASSFFKDYAEKAQVADFELAGNLQAVFSKESPVTNPEYRKAVIEKSASAEVLSFLLDQPHVSQNEKKLAATILLRKTMTSGNYQNLKKFYKKYNKIFNAKTAWCDTSKKDKPLAYQCPNVNAVISNLAESNPKPESLICLSDWLYYCRTHSNSWRVSDVKAVSGIPKSSKINIGSYTADGFDTKDIKESDLYLQVLDDKQASANQRAYALYRLLYCFKPRYPNRCMIDQNQFPDETRKAWFTELKTKYKNTQWAKNLRVYW